MSARLRLCCMLLLTGLVLVRVLLPAFEAPNFGIATDRSHGGWSSDFAAHLIFAKAIWAGKGGYDVDSMLRITGEKVGRVVGHALPPGYTPTLVWLFGPLCLLPPAWSFAVWTALGLCSVWWLTGMSSSPLVAAALLTPTAFECFQLGQTACLTTAALLLLLRSDCAGPMDTSEPRAPRVWLEALVLWALTAKPPLALTAGVALLAGRRWRAVALAAALALLSTAALSPLLGTRWLGDYLWLIRHYDLDTANPAYTWSLVPATMSNLRALLYVACGLGDRLSTQISSGFWVVATMGLVVAGLSGMVVGEARWVASSLAYLLFCPHLTSTEDLLLLLPLVTQTAGPQRTRGANRALPIALILTVLFLAPGLWITGPLRVVVAFSAKLVLAGLFLVRAAQGLPPARTNTRATSSAYASRHAEVAASNVPSVFERSIST